MPLLKTVVIYPDTHGFTARQLGSILWVELRLVPYVSFWLQATWGMVSHGRFSQQRSEASETKPVYESMFAAPACIASTEVPLAKGSHMTKLSPNRAGQYSTSIV